MRREKLYSQIWARPIGYLARDLGVTTAKLREACKVMAIPIPAAGHWAAVRAGRAEAPTPLPQRDGPSSITLDGQPRETLVEWMKRTSPPNTKAQRVETPCLTPATSSAGPRLVPLKVWAALLLGEHAPHNNTLLRWVHDGRIQPQPRRIGRKWFVKPDADYMGD